MNAWDQVVAALATEEIPIVFGLPGNPRHLYDALYASETVRPVLVRHETSGAFMAMAYARVTGGVGCCFGCPGPGVANLVPGILEAFSGCAPVLALGIRASRQTEGMGAFQETDQLGMMRPITKWAVTVERPDRVGWTIRRAIHIATTGKPGPVYVEIPADEALVPVDAPTYVRADRAVRPAADPESIEAAVDLLAAARSPVLVCGGGAVLSGAAAEVEGVANALGIPVLVTPAGRGIISEDHPLFCGSVGLYRTAFPREIYQGADLLITVGSRMEEFQSGVWHYFPEGARFVQIDIDPFELGRNWVPDVAIQSDASLALDALLAAASSRGLTANAERLDQLRAAREAALRSAETEAGGATDRLSGREVVHAVNRAFGVNTILVLENGGSDLWAYYWPHYRVHDAGCVVPPAEQTAMGLGVCGAIAAKLARPDRQVVCTTGDGAFQMGMHELATAVQEHAPVTWVVFNDGALGWPRWTQETALAGRTIATKFNPAVDFIEVAHASGCWGRRVEHPDDLDAVLAEAAEANRRGIPAVVDVPVDPSVHDEGFEEFHRLR
ncbi:MAG TPA: thiamine pyrophosphate-binding protein [Thermomicrobiaceae bacterium]|nr:thiamine pyrophosphate-binding protein [Thermomicrobiaceae bacterium]